MVSHTQTAASHHDYCERMSPWTSDIKGQGGHRQMYIWVRMKKRIVEWWSGRLSQITSMSWAPWACVSGITLWLSISQLFTSQSITVSVNGAHHMLTTLPFSSAHTRGWHHCTTSPNVMWVAWLLWLLCWASYGYGALLCGIIGWCIIITWWPSEHTLKQMTRVELSGDALWHGVAWLVHDHHSTHMAKVELESGWMCLNTMPTQPPSQATCVGCEPLPCPSSYW